MSKPQKRPIELVAPIDYMILGALPPVGALVFGVYPDGREAVQIKKEVPEFKELPMPLLATRIRMMLSYGYIAKSPQSRSENSYQITPEGKKVLDEWKSS